MSAFTRQQVEVIESMRDVGIEIDFSKVVFCGLDTDDKREKFLDWMSENVEIVIKAPQEKKQEMITHELVEIFTEEDTNINQE